MFARLTRASKVVGLKAQGNATHPTQIIATYQTIYKTVIRVNNFLEEAGQSTKAHFVQQKLKKKKEVLSWSMIKS